MLSSAGRRNSFSIIDARQAMYYALSGRVPQGQQPDEATRNAWWATSFKALGTSTALVPAPTSYSEAWHTAGKSGLADYSNRNFLTAARNLGSPFNPYALPSKVRGDYVEESASYAELIEPGASIRFLSLRTESRIFDGHALRMTTESLFSEFRTTHPG